MCCKQLSEFLTLQKCCCGIPLKMGTYLAGSLMLMYSTFMEIGSCQYLYLRTSMFEMMEESESMFEQSGSGPVFEQNYSRLMDYEIEPSLVIGAGVGTFDHAMRSRNDFILTQHYIQHFMRGLIIAWIVINGLLIVSTCLMLYGNAKGKSFLILQWLIVIATIAVGNLLDVVFEIIYIHRFLPKMVSHILTNDGFMYIVICLIETGAILFAFVVVRSYYYQLKLPSMPLSFKTLQRQSIQDNEEEERYGDLT